jgi:enamine deaminase RidA (YjgF/YER057c/UK114 family)
MAQIEWYAADSVYDPPSHAQGAKVTGARAILFIAGQVAFDEQGGTEWLIEVEAVAVL